MVNPNMAIAPARIAAWQREAKYRAKTAKVKPAGKAAADHASFILGRLEVADHKHPLRFRNCDTAAQLAAKLALIREGDGTEY